MPPGPSERKSNFRGGGGRDLGIRPAQFQGLRPPTAENTARRPRGGAVFSAVSARRPLRIRRGGLGGAPYSQRSGRGEGVRGPNLRADLQGRFLQGVVCNYFICVVPQ